MTFQIHLADTLREAGLTVNEIDGWETRGHHTFTPKGIVWHHTATTTPAVRLLVHGRTNLAGPLCNWSTQRDGTINLIAAGRANHAGRDTATNPGRRWVPHPATHNRDVYGDEAINNGVGQKWPAIQLDAMVVASGAVAQHHGWDAERVISHVEWAGRRKIDPAFINPPLSMTQMRSRVALTLNLATDGDDMSKHSEVSLAAMVIDRTYQLFAVGRPVEKRQPETPEAWAWHINQYLGSDDPAGYVRTLGDTLKNE